FGRLPSPERSAMPRPRRSLWSYYWPAWSPGVPEFQLPPAARRLRPAIRRQAPEVRMQLAYSLFFRDLAGGPIHVLNPQFQILARIQPRLWYLKTHGDHPVESFARLQAIVHLQGVEVFLTKNRIILK